MAVLSDIPLRGEKDVLPCPTCGFPVRLVRRDGGYADHYEYIDFQHLEKELPPQDPIVAEELRRTREGKRTIALVGMGPTSCSLAPFDDLDVDPGDRCVGGDLLVLDKTMHGVNRQELFAHDGVHADRRSYW